MRSIGGGVVRCLFQTTPSALPTPLLGKEGKLNTCSLPDRYNRNRSHTQVEKVPRETR
jgi:hypothetical protein